jgi:diguanylate cyclase (GGDEF)-like protein
VDARSSGYDRPRSGARAPEQPHAPPRKPTPAVRLARRLDALGRPAPDSGDAALVRRMALFAYTAASIVAGLALLAWTTLAIPLRPVIDPGLEGTALAGPLGGAVLWTLFGFLGSLRVLRVPGGTGFLTFHLPFVAAALVLGGPTAGAWVGFLSTLERRELEQMPWYGALANHAVFVIGAVAGGQLAQLVESLAEGAGSPGLATALAAASGTLVLAGVTTAMAAITVMLRDEVSMLTYVHLLMGRFGRVSALEIALAWVLVVVYVQIGWWAPALVGALILLIWDNHPMPSPDAVTGLLGLEGFTRRLDAGLGRLRRGLIPGGAAVLAVDLDEFKTVNDRYGHEVGNEILAQVGARLAAQARRPSDLAGRVGGDEFALFLPGVADAGVALRRAEELVEAVAAPIATTVGPISVGASVGVVVLPAWGGVPAMGTVLRHADAAMYLAKRDGGGSHLFDPSEPGPFEQGRTQAPL